MKISTPLSRMKLPTINAALMGGVFGYFTPDLYFKYHAPLWLLGVIFGSVAVYVTIMVRVKLNLLRRKHISEQISLLAGWGEALNLARMANRQAEILATKQPDDLPVIRPPKGTEWN